MNHHTVTLLQEGALALLLSGIPIGAGDDVLLAMIGQRDPELGK